MSNYDPNDFDGPPNPNAIPIISDAAPELCSGETLPSSTGYAQWRRMAIGEVARLCEEALDHDTSWPMFCALVKQRLETETALAPAHTNRI